jgi:hypothetical protein
LRLGLNLQRIDGSREVDDSVEEQPSVVAVTFVTSIVRAKGSLNISTRSMSARMRALVRKPARTHP